MKTEKISFRNLVRQLMPPHKRQAARLWLLGSWTRPLQELFDETDRWRTLIRLEMNVTGQVKVLEGYLRRKYDCPGIVIRPFSSPAVQIGLRHEGRNYRADAGIREQETVRTAMPLRGEIRAAFGEADFIVYVPPGLNTESIRADIERFKQALVKYRIIQSQAI